MQLSIIIPAYNEEKSLEQTIGRFREYLDRQNYAYEIIIVNDGSTDRTGNTARELAAKFPMIKLVEHESNRGKGAAIRTGLLQAGGDFRLFIDADNATTIDHLDSVWPHFRNNADIVIGSRHPRDAAGSRIVRSQARWKRAFGKVGNLIFQALSVKGIWDTQCGFKVLSAQAAATLLPHTTLDRWAIDAEILMLARSAGYRIAIIPVRWTNGPVSRVGLSGYFVTLREVLGIFLNRVRGRYKIDKKTAEQNDA